ncbi:hypothetical protein [Pantanalinema sp. GBBB05]|uniref:hypothetical protein n=1 Tax=Pantanalinema sp. GBBB05 TaxID=2604139 RepID=UPI001D1BA3DB|nr:hypothetical protein [Pantanalinema sp. GBBB05]
MAKSNNDPASYMVTGLLGANLAGNLNRDGLVTTLQTGNSASEPGTLAAELGMLLYNLKTSRLKSKSA